MADDLVDGVPVIGEETAEGCARGSAGDERKGLGAGTAEELLPLGLTKRGGSSRRLLRRADQPIGRRLGRSCEAHPLGRCRDALQEWPPASETLRRDIRRYQDGDDG
jgi:hypothetical protein